MIGGWAWRRDVSDGGLVTGDAIRSLLSAWDVPPMSTFPVEACSILQRSGRVVMGGGPRKRAGTDTRTSDRRAIGCPLRNPSGCH
jgi:hypothetical protein